MDGDQVLVELTGRRRYRGRSPTGRVALVLSRKQERIVGTLRHWRDRPYVVAEAAGPDREISVAKEIKGARPGEKVLVKLDSRLDRLSGLVERVLGDPDDPPRAAIRAEYRENREASRSSP